MQILKLPAVCSLTSLSKTSIYYLECSGKFPRRIKLGSRAVGWLEEDVRAWVAERKACSVEARGERLVPHA